MEKQRKTTEAQRITARKYIRSHYDQINLPVKKEPRKCGARKLTVKAIVV